MLANQVQLHGCLLLVKLNHAIPSIFAVCVNVIVHGLRHTWSPESCNQLQKHLLPKSAVNYSGLCSEQQEVAQTLDPGGNGSHVSSG